MEKSNLRCIFRDICNGYSFSQTDFGNFYVKHLNYENQTELDVLRESFFQEAKKRGLPTTEESLKNLKEEGLWTDEKENSLKKEESFIAKLSVNKKNIYIKSQLDKINVQISESQKKINSLRNERHIFLGNTCENHADQRVTEEFLKLGTFKDKDCKQLFFSEEDFDELDSQQISQLVSLHNNISAGFSDLNIQKLVLDDFFTYYMPFCEDPTTFFGAPAIRLTHNQLKLIIFGRYFKSLLQSADKIPEEYRKDPEKLIDYVNANEKAKEKINSQEGQATSIVGASQEDYEYLNMKGKNTKTVSLSEEAKKKGGALNMKDLMKMMGHD